MQFPLFQRPGTVVVLDDDPDFLDMLALALPRHWHVRLFVRPSDCIRHLQQETPFWDADAWNQEQLVEQWRGGKPLVPQILAYWSKDTERYAPARVCVFDYSMPEMDGIAALAELGDWPGSRVLLTGQADDQVAVRAFNRGLIDQFIGKQAADMTQRLVDAVERLLATPSARHAHIWRATLSPAQSALLRESSVARDLSVFAAKRWAEYIVVGEPFGVLGMDAQGHVSWLQLETAEGLPALAELAEVAGLSGATIGEIRAGRVLANIELRQALGAGPTLETSPAFRVGEQGQLLGASFAVDSPLAPDPANSFARWLARQEPRRPRA
jgi:CheY-like chemotaxis protein